MTQEEKAKAYDEALEVAQRFYKNSAAITKKGLEDMFPELAESEDERIRKKIIATIHLYYGEPLEDEAKEMIAWLEAQGEQKPLGFNIGDKITVNGQICKVVAVEQKPADKQFTPEQASVLDKHIDKFLEQKPAWSEEDQETIDYLIDYLEDKLDCSYTDLDKETFTKEITLLKSIKYRLQPQQKQEWGEEDEKMIGNIRRIIEKYALSQSAVDVNGDLCEKECIDADNWLKNLKDRCSSKSKQEVSSDISIVIEDLRELLCNAGQSPDWVFNLRRDIDILNSLKHLNRWKPSKEQLHGLDVAITTLRCQHNAVIKGLDSLYMDLKKLKE